MDTECSYFRSNWQGCFRLLGSSNLPIRLIDQARREKAAGDPTGAGSAVGSRSPWRAAVPLPAAEQNSRQNGGRVFLNFAANRIAVRLCKHHRARLSTPTWRMAPPTLPLFTFIDA